MEKNSFKLSGAWTARDSIKGESRQQDLQRRSTSESDGRYKTNARNLLGESGGCDSKTNRGKRGAVCDKTEEELGKARMNRGVIAWAEPSMKNGGTDRQLTRKN